VIFISASNAAVRVQDSAAALPQLHFTPVDSVVVESPLPAGVATVVRFLMNNVPPWVQIGGVIVGAVIAAAIAVWMFRNRLRISQWLQTRTRTMQWALGVMFVLAVTAAGATGTATWNYTQHSNDFCTGCHVMNPAFQKFSDIENKHAKLSCHDCHQQSIFASARQLYFWVAERPAAIKVHSKVPNEICATCHITPDTARWQRVAATAGHRVHLESDSSVLQGLQCVTCHGVDVHQFQPVDKTCGQSGCHQPKDTKIVLGKMASQTALHCAGCHNFTADVPALATRDSAAGTLVPGKAQCLGCHAMSAVMKDFSEGKDPHGGKCGTCHNPHTQTTPAAAAASCASSGCHANWADNPFHSGPRHQKLGEQCLICHEPHASKIDASNCEGCHERVRAKGRRPPVPFDTSAVLRRADTVAALSFAHTPSVTSAPAVWTPVHYQRVPVPESDEHEPSLFDEAGTGFDEAWTGDDDVLELPPPAPPVPPVAAALVADTFPHSRHTTLACLECHKTGSGHGDLRFVAPRGCAICHHQSPKTSKCEACHQPAKYGAVKPVTVTVTVPGRAPKPRDVAFAHAQHANTPCVECHTTPVTLAPAPAKATCNDCHAEHHDAGRGCAACHTMAQPKDAHATPTSAHQQCDACHTAATIARLTPNRNLCGTCHAAQWKGHYDAKECSACHFLTTPAAYKAKLQHPPRS
jgi:hypothetical protein